ncbi:MAG: cytochrome-c peroxidase [Cytophagales bacterium]|nr:cytochrome-c peroxidase [Cytophagales bacterium]
MKFFYSLLVSYLLFSCSSSTEPQQNQNTTLSKERQLENIRYLAQQKFKALPEVANNPSNPITPAKIALGKLLYYDVRLSKNGTQSCNSCHNLSSFGVDNLPTSPGDGGQNGDRNSPSVINAAYHFTQFWDGRAGSLEEQATMPILNPIEMGIPNEEFLINRLSKIKLYQDKFQEAFPNDKKPLTFENIAKSIAVFERILVTQTKFDNFLKGDKNILNEQELRGLGLFLNRGCVVCHNGDNLGGNMFQKFGVHDDYWKHTNSTKIDEGRYTITKNEGDKYVFKVPSLRNVTKTAPYFHDGSVQTLKEAVRIMTKINVSAEFNETEINDIIAFLGTLTGDLPNGASDFPKELKP